MLTPAQPVASSIAFAACGVVTSPLPMTGMVFTACATARMPVRFTVPLKPCSRVRPWTNTAAIPAEQTNAVADYNSLWANYALVANDLPVAGVNRRTMNVFTDYTVQEGRFKGLRLGLGARDRGSIYIMTNMRNGTLYVGVTSDLIGRAWQHRNKEHGCAQVRFEQD